MIVYVNFYFEEKEIVDVYYYLVFFLKVKGDSEKVFEYVVKFIELVGDVDVSKFYMFKVEMYEKLG